MKNTFGGGSSEGRIENDTEGIENVAWGDYIAIVRGGMHITPQTGCSGIFHRRCDLRGNRHFKTSGKDPE